MEFAPSGMSSPPGRYVGNEPGHKTAAPFLTTLNRSAHARLEAIRPLAAMLFECVRFIDIEVLVSFSRACFAFPAHQTYINSTGDIVNTFFVNIS